MYFLISKCRFHAKTDTSENMLKHPHFHCPVLFFFFWRKVTLSYGSTQKKLKGHNSFHHLIPLVYTIRFLQSCLKKLYSMLSSEGLIKILPPQTWQ